MYVTVSEFDVTVVILNGCINNFTVACNVTTINVGKLMRVISVFVLRQALGASTFAQRKHFMIVDSLVCMILFFAD